MSNEESVTLNGEHTEPEEVAHDDSSRANTHPQIPQTYREFLAYQVMSDAKKQLVSWAKWIIGVVAFVIALLGIKTYLDIQDKIDSAINEELKSAHEVSSNAVNKFKTESNKALAEYQQEIEKYHSILAREATEASERIEEMIGGIPNYIVPPNIGRLYRKVFDGQNKVALPGELARVEGEPPSSDATVNEVYDNLGIIYKFFKDVYGYDLIPKEGQSIIATVHHRRKYSNAFWNGDQIIFGDGDGEIFSKLTVLDIVCGEWLLGVIQNSTGLIYRDEPGAILNHLRDVFSAMVVQWNQNQTVETATWLIGEGAFTAKVQGSALRSLKSPGTAYDDESLGKDPQPKHIDDYVRTTADKGGVHINSGILNRAFYLVASELGGHSWDGAGTIWFKSLDRITSTTNFEEFATITREITSGLHGHNSREEKAIIKAWSEVGIST